MRRRWLVLVCLTALLLGLPAVAKKKNKDKKKGKGKNKGKKKGKKSTSQHSPPAGLVTSWPSFPMSH